LLGSGRVAAVGANLESPALLRKCKYAFLTLPNYSLIAVAAVQARSELRAETLLPQDAPAARA